MVRITVVFHLRCPAEVLAAAVDDAKVEVRAAMAAWTELDASLLGRLMGCVGPHVWPRLDEDAQTLLLLRGFLPG